MSDPHPLPPPEPTYRAIEATLASHEPGRRFLAEHARRSRRTETAELLDAVARLSARATEATPPAAPADHLAAELPALPDRTIAAGESLVAAADPGGLDPSSAGDDTFAGLMELVQDTFWSMRESGSDTRLCDLLDGLALQLRDAWHARDQASARPRDAESRPGGRIAEVEHRPDRSDTPAGGRRRRARREPPDAAGH